MKNPEIYDTIIVGGGPAAVSAAIQLGRCMRKVLLFDSSESEVEQLREPPRSRGWDCCCPPEFLRYSKALLNELDSVTRLLASVADIRRMETGFLAMTGDGRSCFAKSVLLASDIVSRLPDIHGASQFFGSSLHFCPYCSGWEHRGCKIGAVGSDEVAVSLALKLLRWTPRVTLYTQGGTLSNASLLRLKCEPVDVVCAPISALEGRGGRLERLRARNGDDHPCQALFVPPVIRLHTSLASRVGCDLPRRSYCNHNLPDGGTGIQGLFLTNEREDALNMAVCSAAEGMKVADSVNQWLTDLGRSYLAVPVCQH